jgi:alpha-beta hydrolase superfamily lysophospholipase
LQSNGLLRGEKRLTLMGHSMGGIALMEFTKRYASPEVQRAV